MLVRPASSRPQRQIAVGELHFIASLQDARGLMGLFRGYRFASLSVHPGLFSYRPYGTGECGEPGMSDLFKTQSIAATYVRLMTRRELIAGVAAAGAAFAIQGGDAMEELQKTRILFIAGFGPIVRERDASRKLYADSLHIAFKEESGGYLHTGAMQGAKEFALWPLAQAAESCFGSAAWPESLPAPHAWLEFDVDSVESATAELESRGYRMLIKNKKEPWGQMVSRFLDPDGILVGLTFTPSMRDKK